MTAGKNSAAAPAAGVGPVFDIPVAGGGARDIDGDAGGTKAVDACGETKSAGGGGRELVRGG